MQRFAVLDCNGERKRVDAGLSWGWVALCTSLEARMEKKYIMRVRHGCSLEVAMSTGGEYVGEQVTRWVVHLVHLAMSHDLT